MPPPPPPTSPEQLRSRKRNMKNYLDTRTHTLTDGCIGYVSARVSVWVCVCRVAPAQLSARSSEGGNAKKKGGTAEMQARRQPTCTGVHPAHTRPRNVKRRSPLHPCIEEIYIYIYVGWKGGAGVWREVSVRDRKGGIGAMWDRSRTLTQNTPGPSPSALALPSLSLYISLASLPSASVPSGRPQVRCGAVRAWSKP